MKVIYLGKEPDWMPEFVQAMEFACYQLNLDISTIKIRFAILNANNKDGNKGGFLHFRSRPVEIQIDKLINKNEAICAGFHELAHWRQCKDGAFNKGDNWWYGTKVVIKKGFNNYWNLPWEIQARRVERFLGELWLSRKG